MQIKSVWVRDFINNTYRSFGVSFIVTSLMIVVSIAFIAGYFRGREDDRNDFLSQSLQNNKPFPTPLPTLLPTTPSSPTPTPIPTKPIVRAQVLPKSWGGPELWDAVNKKRVEYGVNPLIERDELCTIASIRLNELLALGKLDNHEGFGNMQTRRPDLKWIFDKYSVVTEFLAEGGSTPDATVSLWENTLGHKKILTGGEYVWGCVYAQNTFAVAITAY